MQFLKRFVFVFLASLMLLVGSSMATAVEASDAAQMSPLAFQMADGELAKFGIFLVVGIFGMFFHYLKKWLRGEIRGSLKSYLFKQHPRQTALAVLTFVGIATTMFLTNELAGMDVKHLLLSASTLGYTTDSLLNQGAGVDKSSS